MGIDFNENGIGKLRQLMTVNVPYKYEYLSAASFQFEISLFFG